ncbi:MAG TPA: hypothetical protein VF484_00815 [Candidatus Limnocylindrales bacterium]
MIPVAVVLLIVAAIVGCVAWIVAYTVHEYRATRPTDDDQDWIAPHAGWIDQNEVEREFWAIVRYQQEVP